MKARGAVVATLLGVMLLSTLYPLRQYMTQDAHVNALVRQARSLDAKIASLRQQQSLLQSDGEIERIAREELGMVRPGEVAFAVVGGAQPGGTDASPSRRAVAPAAPAGAAWYARWWDATVQAVTGMR